jgi:AcrR family transcriptional regulator
MTKIPFKRREPEARRQAILSAARAILGEKDYHDIRMDEVARRAGTAKGTLYLYFSTKDRLFAALTRDLFEQTIRRWDQIESQTAPGEARLKAIIGSQLDFFEKNRGLFLQVVQGAVPCGPGAPKRSDMIRSNIAMLRRNIAEAMKLGKLRRADPEAAAVALFGLIRGFVFAAILGGMPGRLTARAEFVWESFYLGMRP